MYCILVTGIPASGKSTMAEFLAERLRLPMLSKDKIKEILFDDVGFASRSEKVALGISAMNILYYTAQQLMKCGRRLSWKIILRIFPGRVFCSYCKNIPIMQSRWF